MNEAIESVCTSNGRLSDDRVDGKFCEATASLLLSWIDWVEVEVQGFPDLLEELGRLRGAVMVARVVGGIKDVG